MTILILSALSMTQTNAFAASSPSLGTASNFAVLGSSTVTNTGSTGITGDLGLSPGTSITGFPPGAVNGVTHISDSSAAQAQNDAATAKNALTSDACTTNEPTVADIGGQTLSPGVYCFPSSAGITGTLTLSGSGVYIFKIGSTLVTAASNSDIVLTNGATANNVFWAVGSSATLGTYSGFKGTIIATASITATTGATVNGRLIAQTGAVTLDTNNITVPVVSAPSVTLSSIAITTPATRLTYTVGDTLDTSGLVVTGTFSDGSTRIVTPDSVTGFNSFAPVDGQVLTIHVGSKTTSYAINVVAASSATLSRIAITTPATNSYTVGDTLDTSGLVVTGTFSDGSTRIVTPDSVTGFNSFAPVDGQVLTIHVGSKTTSYAINVVAASSATLSRIAITTPATNSYTVGDTLDTSGLVVTGTFSDGSTRIVTPDSVTGFNSFAPVDGQVLTIHVGSKTTTYTINVVPSSVTLSRITITTPATNSYTVGDTLDTSGLVVIGTFSDGSIRVVTPTSVTGFNSAAPVTGQVLTIHAGSKTTTYTINVVPLSVTLSRITITTPATNSYTVGDTLDTSGLVVIGTFSDGSTRVVTPTSVTGFNSFAPVTGQVLTIHVGLKTTTYAINVVAASSLRIFSNTFWQASIGPVGNQISINGYGDTSRDMNCVTGDSYNVLVRLSASADASKYAVINLYENGNTVRIASAQGSNGMASFSGQCGDWKSSNANNGLISVQTDKSSYNYGDTLHMYASLIHPNSPNFKNPIGTFRVVSSTDGSVLFEKSETSGCCAESVNILGTGWQKDSIYLVEFIWGDPNYSWTVSTPIHVTWQEIPSQTVGSLMTDNNQYVVTNGNPTTITFSGHVPANDGSTWIGIISPDNTKTSVGFVQVSSNGYFSKSFDLGLVPQLSESGTYYTYGTFSPCCFATPSFNLPSSSFAVNTFTPYMSSISPQVVQYTTPEFGPLAGMIVVISIIGVVIMSRKSQFHF